MNKIILFISIVVSIISFKLYSRGERPIQEAKEGPVLTTRGSSENESICLLGDGGTGRKEQYEVAKAMEKDDCDAVVYLGDVVYQSGIKDKDDSGLESKFFKPYENLLENSLFLLTMGNHDYEQNPGAWMDVAEEYENIVFPNYFYAYIFNNKVCVLALDTNNFFEEQGEWLLNTLEQLQDNCKVTISAAHHPYKSSGHHGDATDEVKALYERYLVGRIDLIAAGHDHQLTDEGEQYGTRLFVSGSGGKLRALNRSPAHYGAVQYGYIKLEFDDDNVNYRFVGVDGSKISTLYEGSFQAKGIRNKTRGE